MCKPIKLRSYFPHIDLLADQHELVRKINLSIIRLGTIDTLDQYLSVKYKEIYKRFSKQFDGEYIANNCPHCKSLQGTSLTLESMYKLLIEIQKYNILPSCIVETLDVTETSLPKKEWQDIVTEVLKYQR